LRKEASPLIGTFLLITIVAGVSFPLFCRAEEPAREKAAPSHRPFTGKENVFFVNLGDYARGDGTDETDAIQAAVDALVPLKADWKPHLDGYPHRDLAGVLYIPEPQKFYGISRTIKVYEKWNVLIQAETTGYQKRYFHWLGPDEGTMFEFSACMGIRVENLSMTGGNKKVIGLRIGPENRQAGFFKYSSFTNLNISNVAVGMKLGDFPNNGPDIAHNSYRDLFISDFTRFGIVARSGNLANNTIMNLLIHPSDGAVEGIRMEGGELLVLNSCLGGGPTDTKGAAIGIYAGGIQVITSWSEWKGPLLYGHTQVPEAGKFTSSTVRYPTILMGVTHYGPFMRGEAAESENPVPLSIVWDRPTPLSLIGSAFWGGVKLGADSQAVIIDQATTFLNRDGLRFVGEGIERYGRIIHLGTIHPGNPRILEPYVVDRRSLPGTAPPSTGVWKKGDRILNTDPDPDVPAKAWAGWICIEAGEPGQWVPFGALGK